MLITVTFAAALSPEFREAPDAELVEQTQLMLRSIVHQLLAQHPAADLNGDVNVSIQLHRAAS